VHDSALVRRGESGCHLPRELEHLLERKGAALQSVGESLAFDVLHDEVVDPFVGADVMKRADMRVVELGDGFRLALETRLSRRVSRELRRQHLDGDAPVEPRVLRLVDLSHSSSAQRREDLIGSDLQAWFDTHANGMRRDSIPVQRI